MSFSSVATVVIGEPLVDLSLLGFSEDEITIRTDERFLPRILVELGWFPSTSEVKRNRPELFKEFNSPDLREIRIGKKILWLIVGQ
jgi:hypothetical protein